MLLMDRWFQPNAVRRGLGRSITRPDATDNVKTGVKCLIYLNAKSIEWKLIESKLLWNSEEGLIDSYVMRFSKGESYFWLKFVF